MSGLSFDIVGNNADFLRKIEEVKRGVADASKRMQVEGGKMDSAFNIGDTLKKKIYEGSQAVNGLTEKIINQRKTVRDITQDVNILAEAYKRAGKDTDKGKALFLDLTGARESLAKEKNALFELQTQQAQARLSVRKLKDEQRLFQKSSQDVVESNEKMALSFKKTLAAIGGTAMIQKFVSDVVRVRGEFQQLEIAFETMLKSKDKASALMSQLTETAVKTPFDLQSVAQGAKQLLAYGTASEEVNDTLIRLGNIASGLSIPLGDLVYLYGTTQTQGRLFTQDVRQFMGRGIPLVKELAAELGKTEQQINEMVTAGQIGFPQVEKVIRNMTSENGQFYNLMEKQSQSLTGQISNLGDAWDSMLNKIGTQTQGIASAGISAATSLIENYEEVGVILASLVASYGSYKVAIIVVNTLEKANIMIMRQAIIEKKLAAAANITLSNSMAIAAARGKMFALVQRNIMSSLKGIGSTLANPYVLLGAAVGAATYGLYKFYTRETEVEQMQRQYNDTKEAAVRRENEHKAKVDELINSLEDETTAQMDRVGAIEALKLLYPGIIEKYIDEEGHLRNLIALNKELAEFNATKKVEQNKTELQSYDERIKNQEEYIDRMRTNDQSAFDDEVAKLNELKHQRELSRVNVAADYINKAINNTKSMSDADIANTINTYQKALSGNKNGEWFDTDKEFKVDEVNRYISALKNLQTTRATAVHDKEYWENLKKETQSQLDALSDIEAAGKKGAALKDKIAGYDKKINSFTTNSTKQESAADKRKKEQEKRNEELLTLRKNNQKSEVDLMEEGSKKKIAQIELNYQNEIAAIKKQEKEWSKAQAGKLTQEQSISISVAYNNVEGKRDKGKSDVVKEEAEKLKGLLDKYQDYVTKRLNAEKQFNVEREKLEKSGASDARLNELEYQRKETYDSIDNEFAMREDSFKAWADNIANLSLEKLRELLVQAERELERSEFLNPKDPKLAGQRARVTSLKNAVSEKSAETNISPNKRSQKEWQDLYKTLSNVENEFDEIGKAVGCTAGEIISTAGGVTASTLKMIDGIVSLSDSSAWAISSTATAAEKAIQMVEKASVILAIIGAAMKIATEISSTFKGESEEEMAKAYIEQLNTIVDIYDKIIDKQKESIKFGHGFAAIEAATKAMDELNEQIDVYRNISVAGSTLFGSILRTQKEKDEYIKAMKELGIEVDEVNNLVSTDGLSNLSSKQLEYIRDNYKELWAALTDEQRNALQSIIDAEEEGKKIIDQWQEAITGISYDSFYSDFIDMLSDMDTSAEDMAENFGEYLRKSILAAMVAKEFQKDIDKLYQMWVNAGDEKSEGGIEITKDEALAIQEEQKKLTEAMIKRREEMEKVYGWESSGSSSQNSTQKGFEAMSQDTGNELNGRFTALQISNEEIKNSMLSMLSGVNLISTSTTANGITLMEIRNLAISSNSYLEDIAGFQKRIVNEFGSKLDNINSGIKQFNSK